MGELIRQNSDLSLSANILIKEEDGLFVAHCLELDIVAVGDSMDQAQRECVALICAQIEYAFAHDNLDNLFHPAPPEVWSEFFTCTNQHEERRYKLEKRLEEATSTVGEKFLATVLPPWLIAKTCRSGKSCYAS